MSVKQQYGLRTAWEIRDRSRLEACGFVVHGPRGIGKSSFCVHSAAEAIVPYMEKPDYTAIQDWLIFTPQQFCDLVCRVNEKQMVCVWDDAGYWLNRLFWHDLFVREALRYMTLARTQFTALIFNTPSLRMLPNKILELPDVFRVKITKPAINDIGRPRDPLRQADVKSVWFSDDLSKHGVRNEWSDQYSLYMPNDFFAWYEPKRKEYLNVAQSLIRVALEHMQAKQMPKQLEGQLGKTLASPESVQELGEMSKQLL